MTGSGLWLLGAAVATAAITGAGWTPSAASPSDSARAALYASVGPTLTHYELDVERASLSQRESVQVPGSVQYAWRRPDGRHLYVVWSGGANATSHGLTAFDIVPGTGALRARGPSVPLKYRPIHVTTDRDGAHLLIAYNVPPTVSVHRIGADGSIGSEVEQTRSVKFGVYLHQVRVEPSTGAVLVVARGNYAEGGKTTDPGEIDVLDFAQEQLVNKRTIAPAGGIGFNPRHLDFHPTKKWVFVSLEPQNKLQVYAPTPDGGLDAAPLFTRDSLNTPADVRIAYRQLAGTVHVHPSGRFVYQANRGTGTTESDGKRVWAGGFNSIAVFRVDQHSGEPTLMQNADTHGLVPRTFSLDPTGRVLVAANQNEMLVRAGTALQRVPASLAVFRVRDEGTLDYVSKVDVDAHQGGSLFWMSVFATPR